MLPELINNEPDMVLLCMLPIEALPDIDAVAADMTLVAVTLFADTSPVAVTVTALIPALANTLAAWMFPDSVAVVPWMLPKNRSATTLPVTDTTLAAVSNVNAGDPARISLLLNCTWVLAPPASILPWMLPIK